MPWTDEERERCFASQEQFENQFCSQRTIQRLGQNPVALANARIICRRLSELMPHAAFKSPGFSGDPSVFLIGGFIGTVGGKFDGNSRVVLVYENNQFYLGFQQKNGHRLIDACFLNPHLRNEFENHLDGYHFAQADQSANHLVTAIAQPLENGDFPAEHPLAEGSNLAQALQLVDQEVFDQPHDGFQRFMDRHPNLAGTSLTPLLLDDPVRPAPTQGQEQNLLRDLPMSKNTILFGPPGTGKTYTTIDQSLKMLGNPINGDREAIKRAFDQHLDSGHIVFTTFHQSYAYEDFIEGIRVETEGASAIYKIRNGTFKQIARKATFYYLAAIAGHEDDVQLKSMADEYAKNLDKNLTEETRALLHDFRAHYRNATPEERRTAGAQAKRFVLVIDEINRGNISKVFGELITLIEDSKRLGTGESLPTVLPYSGEQFEVPENLYLLGTMNTADRSLATLDIALRRRFFFEELMPNPKELDGVLIDGINIKNWLTTLNKRIQAKRGREFTVGHAFFMSLKTKEAPTTADLAVIMEKQILPLLDEYFFDDWEGIRFVLGEINSNESNTVENFVHWEDVSMPGRSGSEKSTKIYSWNKAALTSPAAYNKLLIQG